MLSALTWPPRLSECDYQAGHIFSTSVPKSLPLPASQGDALIPDQLPFSSVGVWRSFVRLRPQVWFATFFDRVVGMQFTPPTTTAEAFSFQPC